MILVKIKYETLKELTCEETEFIREKFILNDADDNFYVDKKVLDEVSKKLSTEERRRFADILKILNKEAKKEDSFDAVLNP